jgi:sporulation integral membrane protein YtvI
MTEFYEKHKDTINRALFFAGVCLAAYVFFTVLWTFLAPFFFGLLIALAMEFVVRFLQRRAYFPRWVASLVALLIFMAAAGSLGWWLVSSLVRQIGAFAENAPTHAAALAAQLETANLWIQRRLSEMPGGYQLPPVEEMAIGAVTALFGDGMRERGFSFISHVPTFFINVILTLTSAYFFMADRDVIFGYIRKKTPDWLSRRYEGSKKGLATAAGGFLRAQAIIMAMVGAVSIGGLLLLGSPYALLLGLLFAALDFLPILGPGVVILPWAVITAIGGDTRYALGLLIIWGIAVVVRQVVQPKIMGEAMGAHPLASLMAIFIGFRVFGVLGLIIGPALLLLLVSAWPSR